MYKLKKGLLIFVTAFISMAVHSQQINNSKQLLDEVSSKMKAYKNIHLNFSTSLLNEEARSFKKQFSSNIIIVKIHYSC